MSEKTDYIKTMMFEAPQFDQLTQDELETLSGLVICKIVPQGKVLCREGTVGDSLFYVVSGKVEIRKESVDGRQTVLALFSKGSSVGEMSLVEDSPRSATVSAIEDSELLILTRDNFERILNEHPYIGIKILRNLAKSLSARLRHISGRFADVFK